MSALICVSVSLEATYLSARAKKLCILRRIDMAQTRRSKPRKTRRRGALYGPLTFIAICAALVFGMSIFFRVSRIEVEGAAYYTTDEVQHASGIDEGDNLFFINRFTVISRLFSRLPYVETASVTRYLPNRVIITVTESQAIAYVSDGTQNWVIDRNGKVLKQAAAAELSSIIEIKGITAEAPEIGNIILPPDGDTSKIEYLAAILDQIQERGLQSDVTKVDLTEPADATFTYLGRFNVRLGGNVDTEYKFGKLLSAVSQLTLGDQGTLDLSSDDNKTVFSPG